MKEPLSPQEHALMLVFFLGVIVGMIVSIALALPFNV